MIGPVDVTALDPHRDDHHCHCGALADYRIRPNEKDRRAGGKRTSEGPLASVFYAACRSHVNDGLDYVFDAVKTGTPA